MLSSLLERIENTPDKRIELFLGLVALAINLLIFSQVGINVTYDSQIYLQSAHTFWEAPPLPGQREFWYGTYIFLLSLITGLEVEIIVLLQCIFQILASLMIFRLTTKMSGDKLAGVYASLLVIAFVEIIQWNFYILTESLFTSCCLLTAYLIFFRKSNAGLVVFIVFFTALLRPMGVTFLLALTAGLWIKYREHILVNRKKNTWIYVLGVGLVLFPVWFLVESNPDYSFYYSKGEVVYGAALLEESKSNEWLVVDPFTLNYPVTTSSNLRDFVGFVLLNPVFVAELFFKKLFFFFFHVKPYYSILHNAFLGIFLPLVYLFAFFGGKRMNGYKAFRGFSLAFVFLNAMMVALSVEAWDGRFLIPVLPFVFVYSAVGIRRLSMIGSSKTQEE